MNIRLLALLALWSHSLGAGGIIVLPDIIYFGNGASCDFNVADLDSIQDAIAGVPTVLVRNIVLSGGNGGDSRLIFAFDSTLDLRHVTAAGNDVDTLIRTTDPSTVTVHDSILWQPGISTLGGDGTAIHRLT